MPHQSEQAEDEAPAEHRPVHVVLGVYRSAVLGIDLRCPDPCSLMFTSHPSEKAVASGSK